MTLKTPAWRSISTRFSDFWRIPKITTVLETGEKNSQIVKIEKNICTEKD